MKKKMLWWKRSAERVKLQLKKLSSRNWYVKIAVSRVIYGTVQMSAYKNFTYEHRIRNVLFHDKNSIDRLDFSRPFLLNKKKTDDE